MEQRKARKSAREHHPSVEDTLTYRLHLVYKLADQESQRLYPQELGQTLSDARCLGAIGSFEPMSVNRLAELAILNKGQASRAAQSLVDQGLVTKGDVAGDARGVELTLTPRGRKVWQNTMDFIHRRNERVFGCLTPSERGTLRELLDRLAAHLGQDTS
jgi:DNA-binding MarR family transcriptional regulator